LNLNIEELTELIELAERKAHGLSPLERTTTQIIEITMWTIDCNGEPTSGWRRVRLAAGKRGF
jgi:hypothetical protein